MPGFYYLYCLKNKTSRKISLKGIDKNKIYLLPYEDIEAVVTEVNRVEFSSREIKSKLENLKWIEEKIRNHEEVIEEAMKDSPVIPLKFLTIYESKTKIVNILKRNYKKFRGLLDKLKGKAEWGVKVYLIDREKLVDKARKEDEEPMRMEEELKSKPEGIKYFLEKQIEEKISAKVDEKLDKYVKDIFEILSPFSEKKPMINELLPRGITDKKEMIFNVSYLFSEDKLKEFQKVVKRLQDYYLPVGLWIEYSGPWPPYNFVDYENKRKNISPKP
ncbi:MAG: GvpL/GvpF family gas vesicle protein [bacterium]|nr:GvpL/GvpF family gas vesicle protein [bacterium]